MCTASRILCLQEYWGQHHDFYPDLGNRRHRNDSHQGSRVPFRGKHITKRSFAPINSKGIHPLHAPQIRKHRPIVEHVRSTTWASPAHIFSHAISGLRTQLRSNGRFRMRFSPQQVPHTVTTRDSSLNPGTMNNTPYQHSSVHLQEDRQVSIHSSPAFPADNLQRYFLKSLDIHSPRRDHRHPTINTRHPVEMLVSTFMSRHPVPSRPCTAVDGVTMSEGIAT